MIGISFAVSRCSFVLMAFSCGVFAAVPGARWPLLSMLGVLLFFAFSLDRKAAQRDREWRTACLLWRSIALARGAHHGE